MYHITQIRVHERGTEVFCSDSETLLNIKGFLLHNGYIREEKGHDDFREESPRTIVVYRTDVIKPLMIALLNEDWEPLGSSSDGNIYDFKRGRN